MEDDWLTVRLPSGRKLYYKGARIVSKRMPWDPMDVRLGVRHYVWKNKKWTLEDTYGGKLTENIVQAIARDIMANAMKETNRRNIPIILTVHDEVVGEPRKDTITAEGFEDLLVSCQPSWVRDWGIPVAAEAWVGERYRK